MRERGGGSGVGDFGFVVKVYEVMCEDKEVQRVRKVCVCVSLAVEIFFFFFGGGGGGEVVCRRGKKR